MSCVQKLAVMETLEACTVIALPLTERGAFTQTRLVSLRSVDQQLLDLPQNHAAGEDWIRGVQKWKLSQTCEVFWQEANLFPKERKLCATQVLLAQMKNKTLMVSQEIAATVTVVGSPNPGDLLI